MLKILANLVIISALFTLHAQSQQVTIVASEDNIEELLLLDPNNIDFLNIFSIKQKKEKNYIGAIQTLEKIIDLDNTRLPFYLELARLQFIIYDYENAEKNFLFVYRQNIPSNVKNNIRYYLRQIERFNPATINYNFKISYNDNINNGTYADTVRLFGIPFKVNEEAKAKESYELFTDINGAYDFNLDSYQLNTGFLINHSNYAGSAYDRLKYGINVGPEHYYKGQKINWSLLISR